MVVAQAAVSMVLLIGAALLLESFRQVAAIQPGFNPEHAVTMNVNLPLDKYPTDAAKVQFVHAVLDRQAALPGVQSLSAASTLPLVQFQVLSMFLAQGQPDIPVAQRPLAEMVSISPSYFQSLGVPLLAGRDFSGGDDAHSARVCIVSQNLARRYWPNENPVGKHVIFTRREVDYEVIGVAGDVKNTNLAGASRPTIYLDFAQFGSPIIWFTLRTAGDVNAIAKSAEAQIFAVDHSQPVTALQPLSQIVATSMAQRKQVAFLIGGFAVLALVLAMIGLYGVLSYSVAQRTTEIGVRQAIGANRGEIMRMVLAQGLGLSLAGVLVGAAAGIFITKPLTSLLYGVTPTEPWVFGAMALLFALIGALASSIPAWRATRIDPIEALR